MWLPRNQYAGSNIAFSQVVHFLFCLSKSHTAEALLFIRMRAILSSVENAECRQMQAEKGRREKMHSFEHTNIEGN